MVIFIRFGISKTDCGAGDAQKNRTLLVTSIRSMWFLLNGRYDSYRRVDQAIRNLFDMELWSLPAGYRTVDALYFAERRGWLYKDSRGGWVIAVPSDALFEQSVQVI